MSLSEPPPPQRGLTAEQRAADQPAPERAPTLSPVEWVAHTIRPVALTSQAQRSISKALLLLLYPFWAVAVLAAGVAYAVLYYPLWVLLAPLRARQRRNDPEGYEKSQGR